MAVSKRKLIKKRLKYTSFLQRKKKAEQKILQALNNQRCRARKLCFATKTATALATKTHSFFVNTCITSSEQAHNAWLLDSKTNPTITEQPCSFEQAVNSALQNADSPLSKNLIDALGPKCFAITIMLAADNLGRNTNNKKRRAISNSQFLITKHARKQLKRLKKRNSQANSLWFCISLDHNSNRTVRIPQQLNRANTVNSQYELETNTLAIKTAVKHINSLTQSALRAWQASPKDAIIGGAWIMPRLFTGYFQYTPWHFFFLKQSYSLYKITHYELGKHQTPASMFLLPLRTHNQFSRVPSLYVLFEVTSRETYIAPDMPVSSKLPSYKLLSHPANIWPATLFTKPKLFSRYYPLTFSTRSTQLEYHTVFNIPQKLKKPFYLGDLQRHVQKTPSSNFLFSTLTNFFTWDDWCQQTKYIGMLMYRKYLRWVRPDAAVTRFNDRWEGRKDRFFQNVSSHEARAVLFPLLCGVWTFAMLPTALKHRDVWRWVLLKLKREKPVCYFTHYVIYMFRTNFKAHRLDIQRWRRYRKQRRRWFYARLTHYIAARTNSSTVHGWLLRKLSCHFNKSPLRRAALRSLNLTITLDIISQFRLLAGRFSASNLSRKRFVQSHYANLWVKITHHLPRADVYTTTVWKIMTYIWCLCDRWLLKHFTSYLNSCWPNSTNDYKLFRALIFLKTQPWLANNFKEHALQIQHPYKLTLNTTSHLQRLRRYHIGHFATRLLKKQYLSTTPQLQRLLNSKNRALLLKPINESATCLPWSLQQTKQLRLGQRPRSEFIDYTYSDIPANYTPNKTYYKTNHILLLTLSQCRTPTISKNSKMLVSYAKRHPLNPKQNTKELEHRLLGKSTSTDVSLIFKHIAADLRNKTWSAIELDVYTSYPHNYRNCRNITPSHIFSYTPDSEWLLTLKETFVGFFLVQSGTYWDGEERYPAPLKTPRRLQDLNVVERCVSQFIVKVVTSLARTAHAAQQTPKAAVQRLLGGPQTLVTELVQPLPAWLQKTQSNPFSGKLPLSLYLRLVFEPVLRTKHAERLQTYLRITQPTALQKEFAPLLLEVIMAYMPDTTNNNIGEQRLKNQHVLQLLRALWVVFATTRAGYYDINSDFIPHSRLVFRSLPYTYRANDHEDAVNLHPMSEKELSDLLARLEAENNQAIDTVRRLYLLELQSKIVILCDSWQRNLRSPT